VVVARIGILTETIDRWQPEGSSKNVMKADGASWEIKCAAEENVPVLGVRIHGGDNYKPLEVQG
jgi:hypothetical protein